MIYTPTDTHTWPAGMKSGDGGSVGRSAGLIEVNSFAANSTLAATMYVRMRMHLR